MWARARATRARAARGFAGASTGPSDAEPRCLYAILRVSPDATDAQIKDGFRRAAKRLHPDVLARGDANEADARTDTFVRAVAAYEILSCERRRALYDAERSSRWLRAPSGGFAASAGAFQSLGRRARPLGLPVPPLRGAPRLPRRRRRARSARRAPP